MYFSAENKLANPNQQQFSTPQTIYMNNLDDSEDTSCWEMCCRCCRKRRQTQEWVFDHTNLTKLAGEYEYLVEKLHIVKVPLLLCGTQEDLEERLAYLNADSRENASQQKPVASNVGKQFLPQKEAFQSVYYMPETSSFVEACSRTDDSNRISSRHVMSGNVSTEEIANVSNAVEKDVKSILSKDTVTSKYYAIIPSEKKASPGRNERQQLHSVGFRSLPPIEIREGREAPHPESPWPLSQSIVASVHTPQRGQMPTKGGAQHDSARSDRYFSKETSHPAAAESQLQVPGSSGRDTVRDTSRSPVPANRQQIPVPLTMSEPRRFDRANLSSAPAPTAAVSAAPTAAAKSSRSDHRVRINPVPQFPRTVRSRLPSSAEPRPSTSRDVSAPHASSKGSFSQFTPIVYTSSSESVTPILSQTSSIKSAAVSKDSDMLIEENKPVASIQSSPKKIFVDVSGRSLPKSEVHRILNQYSSIFVENLKDPVPKDPLTMSQNEPDNQPSVHTEAPQSSRRPSVAEALSEKGSHQFMLVPSASARGGPSSSRAQSTVRDMTVGGIYVKPLESSPNETSQNRSGVIALRRDLQSSNRRKGDQNKSKEATEIRHGVILQPKSQEPWNRPKQSKSPSHSRKKSSSPTERNATVEDDTSIELGVIDLTEEQKSTSSEESVRFESHRRQPPSSPADHHSQFDNRDPPASPTNHGDNIPAPVHASSLRKRIDTQHTTPTDVDDINLFPGKVNVRGESSEKSDSPASSLRDASVIKSWKITFKNQKDSKHESMDDNSHDETDQ